MARRRYPGFHAVKPSEQLVAASIKKKIHDIFIMPDAFHVEKPTLKAADFPQVKETADWTENVPRHNCSFNQCSNGILN